MKMLIKAVLATFLLSLLTSTAAIANPIEGRWQLLDHETKKPAVIFNLKLSGSELKGTVAEIFTKPGEEANPICTNCSGAKKNQPIKGLEIFWGLIAADKDGEFKEGHMLSPEDGKEMRCQMKLSPDGKFLKLKIYFLAPIFGMNETLIRE